jgi:ribosomal protein L37AE/L43A
MEPCAQAPFQLMLESSHRRMELHRGISYVLSEMRKSTPDDAAFCSKCGAKTNSSGLSSQIQSNSGTSDAAQILAPSNAQSLKCPSCGAPVAPKFGEMIITCEYCGTSVTLGNSGWANIQKQTMLPLTIQSTDEISNRVKSMMDRGMLHRHLQESSTLEEMTLQWYLTG